MADVKAMQTACAVDDSVEVEDIAKPSSYVLIQQLSEAGIDKQRKELTNVNNGLIGQMADAVSKLRTWKEERRKASLQGKPVC